MTALELVPTIIAINVVIFLIVLGMTWGVLRYTREPE